MEIYAGTGHRPEGLGLDYSRHSRVELLHFAVHTLEAVIVTQDDLVLSGGALGWDQALAAAALTLGIPYSFALPFRGFDERWPDNARRRLEALMQDAEEVVYVSPPPYAAWKLHARNVYMVDHADYLLALWSGKRPSGTYNCVKYAEGVDGCEIIHLWNYWADAR